jgi:hypothetical protein
MRYAMGLVLFLACATFFSVGEDSKLRAVAIAFAGGAAVFLMFVQDQRGAK